MRILLLIFLTVYSAAIAAEVFRWVDDSGEVHYSDRPHEGAEMVTLPQAQTFSMPAAQSVRRNTDTANDAQEAQTKVFSYTAVNIVSPTQNEVMWSAGGKVKVSVSVQPELRRGHSVMIYLDDKMVGGLTGNKREMEMTEVFRGDHTLHAEVRDAIGVVVGKGNSVMFTVKQTSIQNPSSPNVPPVPAPVRSGPGG